MKNDEIELNRIEIKNHLAKTMDYYWDICDKYACFDFNLTSFTVTGGSFTKQIVESGTRSLCENYYNLVDTIAYSEAFNRISQDLEKQDTKLSNTFKFRFRNYHSRKIIPALFEFADHIAYHINELSEKTIFEFDKEHLINFRKITETLKNKANVKVVKIEFATTIFETLFSNLLPRFVEFLQVYRNTVTHRYEMGIDRMLKSFRSKIRNKSLGLVTISSPLYRVGKEESLHFEQYGTPDVHYSQFSELAPRLFENSKKTLIYLNEIGYIAKYSDG